MNRKKRKIRISLKLFLLFTYVGLIPIIFISLYTYYEINRVVAIEAENRLIEVGSGLSGDINRLINSSYRTMRLLGKSPIIRDIKATRVEKERELKKITSYSPDLMALFIIDKEEVVAKGGTYNFPTDKIEIKSFFRDSPKITPPFASPKFSSPAFMVSIPIVPSMQLPAEMEETAQVLVGVFNLEELWDMTILTRIGKTGRAIVLDNEGRRVAGVGTDVLFTKLTGKNIEKIMTVGKGIIHYTDDDNEKYIVFGALVPALQDIGPEGLRVVVFFEENEAYLIADKIRKGLPYAMIIILIATSLVSLILSDAISRPIRKLTRATELIAKGEFVDEISPTSNDEIGVLTDSFNYMAKELKDSRDYIESYNKELEKLVRERSRKLKESEEKYRMVVEGSGDGWVILDNRGIIKFANRAMEKLVAKKLRELLGRELDEFVSLPKGMDAEGSIYDTILKDRSGQPKKIEIVGAAGKKKYLEIAVFTLLNDKTEILNKNVKENVKVKESGNERREAGPLFLAHLKDVTDIHILESERETLKLELMERAKHSQIGIMTEGLFHNLNNPLQALVTLLKVNSEDLEKEFTLKGKKKRGDISKKRQELLKDTEELYNLSKRLSDQVKNLMSKVRNEGKRESEDIDINQILIDEVHFLEADLFFKHKIEKELILDKNLPVFKGVYSDISQSFVNIVLNAMDGMRETEKRKLTVKTAIKKKNIVVTFHDTGIGIDKVDIPNIFEPFFTTKRGSVNSFDSVDGDDSGNSGTGLGLYTVDFLLKPYGVTYNVTSKLGDTSFEITFPI